MEEGSFVNPSRENNNFCFVRVGEATKIYLILANQLSSKASEFGNKSGNTRGAAKLATRSE